jgi:hypothetical protein
VVAVPININAGSDGQLLSLHDAYALGGEEELRTDVESALNLTIDNSAVLKQADFADFLAGLPAINVTFPRDVLGADDAVMYAKGPQSLSAQEVAKVITTRSPTQPERLRQPNIDALWTGITAAIGTGRTGETLSAGPPTSFAELATRMTAGQSASRGLIARQLGEDQNPERLDVESSIDRFGPRVRQHRPGMTRPAAGCLSARGARRLRRTGAQDDQQVAGARWQRRVDRSQRRIASGDDDLRLRPRRRLRGTDRQPDVRHGQGRDS